MSLPSPTPPPEKGLHITNAVFSSQYTYVSNLHLWYTKTETVTGYNNCIKTLGKCRHKKKVPFQLKAQLNANMQLVFFRISYLPN